MNKDDAGTVEFSSQLYLEQVSLVAVVRELRRRGRSAQDLDDSRRPYSAGWRVERRTRGMGCCRAGARDQGTAILFRDARGLDLPGIA